MVRQTEEKQRQSPTNNIKSSRSAGACEKCHRLHVRCDRVSKGGVCSNCLRDGISECKLFLSVRARGQRGRFANKYQLQDEHDEHDELDESSEAVTSHPVFRERVSKSDKVGCGSRQDSDNWTLVLNASDEPNEENNQIVYVGESWTLAFVLRQLDPRNHKLHFSVSDKPLSYRRKRVMPKKPFRCTDPNLDGAFRLPRFEQQVAISEAFFTYFNPIYPILEHKEFMKLLRNRWCSITLLQSVLCIGVTHCDPGIISRLGFSTRLEAIESFYTRAKVLIDAELETDLTVLIQSTFILSFHWSNLRSIKDPFYWMGISIRLAQSVGMHRCTAASNMTSQNRSLWKVTLHNSVYMYIGLTLYSVYGGAYT